jgi:hypothetical protein
MTKTGGCLCGTVKFLGKGQPSGVHVCHCEQCARWTGGPAMCVEFEGGIDITGAVTWFASSEWAERGFCGVCGSGMFYRLKDGSYINVAAGFLDERGDLAPIDQHIFVDRKPRFYDFADNAPRLTGEEFLKQLQSGQGDDV